MTHSLAELDIQSGGFELYEKLRHEQPVYFDPAFKMFVVSRYEDIAAVFRQPNLFSNALALFHAYRFEDVVNEVLDRKGHGRLKEVLPMTDPPVHTRVRATVATIFSPRRISKIQADIEKLTHELIDRFVGDGQAEIVSQFAVPLPVTVISDLLSLPRDRWQDIRRWTHAYSSCAGNRLESREEAIAAGEAIAEMQNHIVEHLEDRKAHPGDDVLTDLVKARVAGYEPLDDKENLAVAVAFVGAGHESTTVAITQVIRLLALNPDVVAQLRAAKDQETAIRLFVEEALRYDPPLNALPRVATADTEVGGVRIPAGSPVMVVMASGNRDESAFGSDAASLCPARANANSHQTFGGGVHMCLGNMLARAELRCVVRAIVGRLDKLRLSTGRAPLSDYSQAIMPWNMRLHRMEVEFETAKANR